MDFPRKKLPRRSVAATGGRPTDSELRKSSRSNLGQRTVGLLQSVGRKGKTPSLRFSSSSRFFSFRSFSSKANISPVKWNRSPVRKPRSIAITPGSFTKICRNICQRNITKLFKTCYLFFENKRKSQRDGLTDRRSVGHRRVRLASKRLIFIGEETTRCNGESPRR